MLQEIIDLYEFFSLPRKGCTGGYLTVTVPARNGELKPKIRPAMLIIPGGGYHMVSEREGEPVAMRFLLNGYATFVLSYTVQTPFPTPFIEGAMAMTYIRENAEKYGIDGERVGAVGFSAGGHLAGMLATLFEDKAVLSALGDRANARPDAVLLSYPVVTTEIQTCGDEALKRAIKTISGGDEALKKALSIETRVTKSSPPAFIWHTFEDGCVPVENALCLAQAYRACGVPFELHIFEKGWHGLSVASAETENEPLPQEAARNAAWVDLAFSFLKARGFCVKTVE